MQAAATATGAAAAAAAATAAAVEAAFQRETGGRLAHFFDISPAWFRGTDK
jgi:hypothetical protein